MKHLGLFLITIVTLALTALLLITPLDGSIALTPVEAQDATLQNPTVRVDPAESAVGVGERFTISVMIDEASDLGAFEFTLHFVTTTVTVDNVALGNFPGSTGRMTIPIVLIIDNQAGVTSYAVATVGSAPGPGGSGVLATVALTAQGSGESPLDLEDVIVVDTSGKKSQTTTVQDGTVVVGTTPTATSTPTRTATPTPTSTPTSTPTTTPTSSEIYLPLVLKGW